jgi:hypothetical protein
MNLTLIEEFSAARNALLNAATAIDSKHFHEARGYVCTLRSQCDSIEQQIDDLLLLDSCKNLPG